MRTPSFTRQFKKDLERMKKRGKNSGKLKAIMSSLIDEEALPERHRDHALVGNFQGRRECHIEPDWLLIYKLEDNDIIFERTGSHSDLFK
ncbi:MAG: type II toxin-antitoxin system YafQ family toxin [Chloroflexota bacterium]|jgi:mRNA interferase YafQ